LLKNH